MSRSGFGTMNAAENLSDTRLGTCATEKSLMKPYRLRPWHPAIVPALSGQFAGPSSRVIIVA